MAEIYLAKASGIQGFEKLVVVKRILPQLARDNQFIEMFLDEARVAATLQHPNIVQMYDIGAADDNYFISMEYVHGEDVRSIMRRLRKLKRPLPMDQAINVCIGVCAGLHYAHDKLGFDGQPLGIVHRDINPQNVIVTYDGGVKVVDFGIAKASNRLNTETRHGTLKGKIPYMSPEQCQGRPLDRRSDIYAIGILLYELTTGSRLYKGESDFEIMKQIVEDPVVPPSSRKQPYPLELEQIVMRALQKEVDPNEDKLPFDYRYQNAQELQADLESFVRQERLVVSNIALSAFMHEIFAERIDAWRQASSSADEKQLINVIAERKYGSSASGSSASLAGVAELDFLDDDDIEELPDSQVTVQSDISQISAMVAPSLAEVDEAEKSAASTGPTNENSKRPLILALVGVAAIAAAAIFLAPLLLGGDSEPADTSAAMEAVTPVEPRPAPQPQPQPTTGAVAITTTPPGAAIFIDDKQWHAPAPAKIEGLAAGKHSLRVELADHEAKTVEFSVSAGEIGDVAMALTPTPPVVAVVDPPKPDAKKRDRKKRDRKKDPAPDPVVAPTGSGTLRIGSSPSCEVIIDGKASGSTPIAKLELPAGKHKVQLISSRYGIDRTYVVVIKPNEMTKKKYTFPIDGN